MVSRKRIYRSRIPSVKNTTIDLSSSATVERYRLIDCNAYLNDRELRIYEFRDFPDVPYAAISYVWKGNPVSNNPSSPHYWRDRDGTFVVKGAEDGDPVSMDVLYHVCKASVERTPSIGYIWLDRLCILQTDSNDKAWQIRHMYSIYHRCSVCWILPGGIRRLVGMHEETSWIQRAWTLQETMAPKEVKVIFAWKYPRVSSASATALFVVRNVVPGESAQCDVRGVLEATVGRVELKNLDTGKVIKVKFNVFGDRQVSSQREALVAALGADTPAARAQAIWRCALMRTSSRPVDMIFSIMQMFDVTLDPKAFGKMDRHGATVALAQAILGKGRTASWLGATYQLVPNGRISSFPIFPETSVSGKAYYRTKDGRRQEVAAVIEGQEMMTSEWIKGLPKGRMTDEGYFVFSAKALRVKRYKPRRPGHMPTMEKTPQYFQRTSQRLLKANDGSIWEMQKEAGRNSRGSQTQRRRFVIIIGKQVRFRQAIFGMLQNPREIRAIMVEEETAGKFRRVKAWFEFDNSVENWIQNCLTERTFRLR